MLLRALLISLLLHFFLIGVDGPLDVLFSSKGSVPPVKLSASLAISADSLGESGQEREAQIRANQVPVTQTRRQHFQNSDFGRNFGSTATTKSKPGPSSGNVLASGQSLPSAFPDHAQQSESISADGERLYRLNLAREARRFKTYPDLARASGWQGVAIVAIDAPSIGALPVVSLARSSGHRVLDDQALEMMTQAVARALIPPEMAGRRFRISVPLEYSLAD